MDLQLDQPTVNLINGLLHSSAATAYDEDTLSMLTNDQFRGFLDWLIKGVGRDIADVIESMYSEGYLFCGPKTVLTQGCYLPFEFAPTIVDTWLYPSPKCIFTLANILLHDGDGQLNDTQYQALITYAKHFLSLSYVREIDGAVEATDGYYYAAYEIGF